MALLGPIKLSKQAFANGPEETSFVSEASCHVESSRRCRLVFIFAENINANDAMVDGEDCSLPYRRGSFFIIELRKE